MKKPPPKTAQIRTAERPCTSCPYCAGRGQMPLPPHLLAAWTVLDTDPARGQIAAELADKMNVTAAGAAGRLNQLCGLGLAVVVRMRPGESGRSKPAAEWIRRATISPSRGSASRG